VTVHLASGLLEREGRVLLVATKYPNHALPLWNLPGGRQRSGELLRETVVREFFEETSLRVTVAGLRYVAESYDRSTGTHFLATVFSVQGVGNAVAGDVASLAWCTREELASRIAVAVVREPLLANLADPSLRYFAFDDAGITIEFGSAP
jgi:ADP-ribose pyrophosphatase YjhB (NUDIX family)